MNRKLAEYMPDDGRCLFRLPGITPLWFFLFLVCVLLYTPAYASESSGPRSAANQIVRYERAIISEDVTLRGNVTISGSLTIASQATVRIEPGTHVQIVSSSPRQPARVVVMGRIVVLGTAENPVLFSAGKEGWGGITLLSSMKNNQFENCRIENSEYGIEARYSSLTTSGLQIVGAKTGIALFDCIASVNRGLVSRCDTAFTAVASEVEMQNSSFDGNLSGIILQGSSAVVTGVTITHTKNKAFTSHASRLKITSCTLTDNATGIELGSSEGEIVLSRFSRNSEAGMHLASSPVKISRCQIVDNGGDGLQFDDNRATVWGNVIQGNARYNVVYKGLDAYSLVQNWWGSVDESSVTGTIFDGFREARYGHVVFFPWLTGRPPLP